MITMRWEINTKGNQFPYHLHRLLHLPVLHLLTRTVTQNRKIPTQKEVDQKILDNLVEVGTRNNRSEEGQ